MTTVLRDVVFAERIGFRPLSLDLHLPEALPAPVVVFVHGGGWRLGSRRTFTPGIPEAASFGRITAAGVAVASVDHRLSGEARFPGPVEDVVLALDWLEREGARHGLEGRPVLWGESSGAHLAALAAIAAPDRVAGVIDWYGPADLTTLGRHLFPDDPDRFDHDAGTREAGLLGGPVGLLPDAALAASPARQVTPALPPFLVAHGEADDLMPIAQSEALVAALQAAGVAVEFHRERGAGHFWRGATDAGALFDRAIGFARERFRAAAR
ncbi:alpha/beta hydrolase [Amnibacterium sp. CER49]|uniref:alpha/beta hydrolase n=1 Tax=Amnibacterium sp. CER49 TaxID=3039161 RepID=UPI00244D39BD|nr:alpha/beta hydrolase [Amnibacterium sp. CER49]MDH2443178.1 alpha/beta hydrolase [Amnibacterium sp. CER49]